MGFDLFVLTNIFVILLYLFFLIKIILLKLVKNHMDYDVVAFGFSVQLFVSLCRLVFSYTKRVSA